MNVYIHINKYTHHTHTHAYTHTHTHDSFRMHTRTSCSMREDSVCSSSSACKWSMCSSNWTSLLCLNLFRASVYVQCSVCVRVQCVGYMSVCGIKYAKIVCICILRHTCTHSHTQLLLQQAHFLPENDGFLLSVDTLFALQRLGTHIHVVFRERDPPEGVLARHGCCV
jgi:hypothetical protein